MKNFRIIVLAVIMVQFSTRAIAQAEPNNNLTISAEILAPVLGGGIGEVGYNFGYNRIAASISFLPEIPKFYNAQSDDFTASRNYVDLFYTRFLNENQTGFHYGVSVGYIFDETINLIETDYEGTKDYFRAGLRAGYFWHPFKNLENGWSGLFIEPAINIGFALNEPNVVFGDQIFEASALKISGPLFHLGYKF